jgi:hypothetical protein
MNRDLAHKVANAVLYEGYMLYPYRPSALKNRQRWTFGILYPPAYSEVRNGTERSYMHTECLLEAPAETSVTIELRFLHLMTRKIFQIVDGQSEPVSSLMVDDSLVESWDDAIEGSMKFVATIGEELKILRFTFPASINTDEVKDRTGRPVGSITGTQHEICAKLSVSSTEIQNNFWKVTIDVCNDTPFSGDTSDRNASLTCSLLSAHTIITAHGGSFVSLLEPPDNFKQDATACVNVGNFPVLVGDPGERDMLFCSPIVLYDYPQIAPESAGDFYDATEIDEMLTLRVMTLTDEEKNEMRLADDRVRALLERTEQSAREQLARTHGIMRNPRPASHG